MYLEKLLDIIKDDQKKDPFVCIRDLVENGLSEDRFTSDDGLMKPTRHDITLFIAAWCRFAGLEPEIYGEWLINYSVDVLSKISSSSKSQIRHSTKSSIKYIHRSNVDFICNCENNIFKAHCSPDCPIYDAMKIVYERNLEAEQQRILEYQKKANVPEPDPESLPVTKRYEKQFLEAVGIIEERLKKGDTKKTIAAFLQSKGYKTRRGYDWSPATVSAIAVKNGWSPKRKRVKDKSRSM